MEDRSFFLKFRGALLSRLYILGCFGYAPSTATIHTANLPNSVFRMLPRQFYDPNFNNPIAYRTNSMASLAGGIAQTLCLLQRNLSGIDHPAAICA